MNTKFASLALGTFFVLAVALVTPLRAQFAYVVNELDGTVSAYNIGSNGALTPVPGSPFPAGFYPASMIVDPTGKFAYVANRVSFDFSSGPFFNVSAYNIGSNGALTPVPGSPFATGAFPTSVTVDPTGKFAYAANGGSGVSAYNIGSNGALTPVPDSPFPAGLFPISVAGGPNR